MKKISHLFKHAEEDRKAKTAPMKTERELDTVELDMAELDQVAGGGGPVDPGGANNSR
jgi:hypothetical protein